MKRKYEIFKSGDQYPVADITAHPLVETGVWYIALLWVSPNERGQGYANELLNEITTDADAEDVTLTLTAQAGDEEETGLDQIQLEQLYTNHGFQPISSSYVYNMVRFPQDRNVVVQFPRKRAQQNVSVEAPYGRHHLAPVHDLDTYRQHRH